MKDMPTGIMLIGAVLLALCLIAGCGGGLAGGALPNTTPPNIDTGQGMLYGGMNGYVKDATSGIGVENATLTVSSTGVMATTFSGGYYSFATIIPVGSQTVTVTAGGYKSKDISVDIQANSTINTDVYLEKN